jgi:hypothetical protein
MVKDGAQLYTMEGIAAGLIMLLTAYLVLGSTAVYTPGDTHITDMQLEQVGSDILRVMDTPLSFNNATVDYRPNQTMLELLMNTTDNSNFYRSFNETYLCNGKAVAREVSVGCPDIRINANVWYLNKSAVLGSYRLNNPNPGAYLGTGPGVRVTHWVLTNVTSGRPSDMRMESQAILVEVVMWKA